MGGISDGAGCGGSPPFSMGLFIEEGRDDLERQDGDLNVLIRLS